MNKIKSWFGLVLIVIISMMSITLWAEETNTFAFDLEDLEEELIANNLEIERAIENVKIAEYKLEKAEDEEDMVASDAIETAKNEEYYIREGEMELAYQEWLYKEKEQELLLQAKEYYYDYLLTVEEIKLQNSKIDRIRDNISDMEQKVDLGLATLSDVTELEISRDNEKLVLQELEAERESLVAELNLLMHSDFTTNLEVKSEEVPYDNYSVKDLEEKIEEALSENGELAYIDETANLLYLEASIYKEYNSGDTYDRTITEKNEAITQKRYDYKDELLSLEYTIRQSYNDLLNAKDDVTLAELKVNNLSIDLNTINKRYTLGLENDATILEIQEQVAFAELELERAKLDYYLAIEAFKNLIS